MGPVERTFKVTHNEWELGRVRAGVMSLLETEALMPKTGGGLPWIATAGHIEPDVLELP